MVKRRGFLKWAVGVLCFFIFLAVVYLITYRIHDRPEEYYESKLNDCLFKICNGEKCSKYPRNKANIELFGEFDEKLRKNQWICGHLPLKLYYIEDHTYVSDILDHNGLRCQFIVTFYGFIYSNFEIELDCSYDKDHEFFYNPPLGEIKK